MTLADFISETAKHQADCQHGQSYEHENWTGNSQLGAPLSSGIELFNGLFGFSTSIRDCCKDNANHHENRSHDNENDVAIGGEEDSTNGDTGSTAIISSLNVEPFNHGARSGVGFPGSTSGSIRSSSWRILDFLEIICSEITKESSI